jgi:putative tricarboxylic transport membrane protein
MLDLLNHAGPALSFVLQVPTLGILLLGIMLGIILGALPGFGSSQSMALLFPMTFAMSPEHAILFFIAVYSAAEYGGSVPAILIRTPGTPAQSVTVLDGYAMTRKGLAGKALKISLISGVLGGIISTLIFIVGATSLAEIGLQFGPGEMFALGIFGLSIIGTFFGKSPTKGFLAAGIGLLLGTIGSSGFGGMRFTFDQGYLMDGLPLIVVVIGLLAAPEGFRLCIDHRKTIEPTIPAVDALELKEKNKLRLLDIKRLIPTWIRCSLIGTAVGIIPGAGASVGALVAYNEEKRWSKRGDQFGTGVEEGLAAPEISNNSVVAGTLVPTLTLGIPGSGAAAILLGVLISKGVVPGPMLFEEQPQFIMTVFLGLIVGNFIMLAIGLIGARTFAMVAKIPRRIIGPFVMILIVIGTYAYANYGAHVVMALVIGAVAYYFDKLSIPAVPIVLAFVMGPIIELNMNRAMTIHAGDMMVVLTRPITVTILLASLATIYFGISRTRKARLIEED